MRSVATELDRLRADELEYENEVEDVAEDETEEIIEARTRSRGHSTPQMAGRFAKTIGARRLALNHFSSRYRGDDDVKEEAKVVMDKIRELAEKEYGGEVVCARDLMTINVSHAR